MAEQDLFDFARVHLKTTGDDHILDALNHIEVPVLIHLPQVACTQPPVTERGTRFLIAVPISLHHVRSLHHNLTYLTRRNRFTRSRNKTSSTSRGYTLKPLAMITSLMRSTT